MVRRFILFFECYSFLNLDKRSYFHSISWKTTFLNRKKKKRKKKWIDKWKCNHFNVWIIWSYECVRFKSNGIAWWYNLMWNTDWLTFHWESKTIYRGILCKFIWIIINEVSFLEKWLLTLFVDDEWSHWIDYDKTIAQPKQ